MKTIIYRTCMTMIVLACSSLCASSVIAADTSSAEKLGWRLGVQAYTFRELTFFETVDKVHELGLKYIEMYPGQKLKPGSEVKTGSDLSESDVAELQAKLKAADVKLVSYGVADVPRDEPNARKQFEWAKKMGIEVLVTERTPNTNVDKMAQNYGIKVAIHNHPSTWPPERVLSVTEKMSPMVGACADVGHWKRAGLDTAATLKKVGSRVIHIHFKDLAPAGNDMEDVPWGTGQSDARGMLAQLKSQNFKGYLMIEYEHGSVDELMHNLPKCIQFFNETTTELTK